MIKFLTQNQIEAIEKLYLIIKTAIDNGIEDEFSNIAQVKFFEMVKKRIYCFFNHLDKLKQGLDGETAALLFSAKDIYEAMAKTKKFAQYLFWDVLCAAKALLVRVSSYFQKEIKRAKIKTR